MNRAKNVVKRAHPLWLAYVIHRVSGVTLAVFLPVHFWVLAMSITAPKSLDRLLYMSPSAIKIGAEVGLVFLLAVHLFGGLRLIALEWLPWSAPQKTLAAAAVALSLALACLFFLQVV